MSNTVLWQVLEDINRITMLAYEKYASYRFNHFGVKYYLVHNNVRLLNHLWSKLINFFDNNVIFTLGDVTTSECSYCQNTFIAEFASWHEKKCLEKPLKCPDCSEVVLLQNWYDHECHMPRAEGINPIQLFSIKCTIL